MNTRTKMLLACVLIGCAVFFAASRSGLGADTPTLTGRCDGPPYPSPNGSPYVLPYKVGSTYRTGLTNCSSSFHSPGQPDQYAFDFDMPEGTPILASRGGVVAHVVENNPSSGGGVGNYVLVRHTDGTHAYYLHSPENGISVEVGAHVRRGEQLGISGRSGLAGYPHLHFIVVTGNPDYPYQGLPISFRNAIPQDEILRSRTKYLAGWYLTTTDPSSTGPQASR